MRSPPHKHRDALVTVLEPLPALACTHSWGSNLQISATAATRSQGQTNTPAQIHVDAERAILQKSPLDTDNTVSRDARDRVSFTVLRMRDTLCRSASSPEELARNGRYHPETEHQTERSATMGWRLLPPTRRARCHSPAGRRHRETA